MASEWFIRRWLWELNGDLRRRWIAKNPVQLSI